MGNNLSPLTGLVERLREVPRGQGHSFPVKAPNGEPCHRVVPYGNMMNEAADALEALSLPTPTVDREAIAHIVARAYGGSLWPGLGVPGDYPTADEDYRAADAILSLLHPIDGDRFSAKAGDSERSGAAVNDSNSESALSQTGDATKEAQFSAGSRATVSDDISYAGAEREGGAA